MKPINQENLKQPSYIINKAITFCQSLPISWLGLRLMFIIRKCILFFGKEPFYVKSENTWFLLFPSNNLSDKRLLCCPKMLDGEERKWFSRNLPLNCHILDIGANVGGYCLLLKSMRPDLKITAIEADPYMYQRLKRNLELNEFADINILKLAVTDKNKTVLLNIDVENRGRSSIVNHAVDAGNSSEVSGQALSDILQNQKAFNVEMIKMDIEGHEHDVLKAFFQNENNKAFWPRYFQIEQYRNQSLNKAVQLLQQQGYEIIFRGKMNVILDKNKNHQER